jgi:CIC family chloride channel protein
MSTEVDTVPLSLPLRRLFDCMDGHTTGRRHQGYPAVDEFGRLAGMVMRSDLPELAQRDALDWLVVADLLASRPLVVTWPDEPLHSAAESMLSAGVDRLPVVLREKPDRLVGILSRSDVVKALAQRSGEEPYREKSQSWFRSSNAA